MTSIQHRGLVSRRAVAAAPVVLAVATALPEASASATQSRGAGRTAALSAEDFLGIQELYARYAWCYDCNDEADYLANFTDDAIVIGIGLGQIYRGKEAIRSWYRYLIGLRTADDDDWLHDAYHHRTVGDRRSCLVYSYATHFNSNTAARRLGVRSAGYFVSDCVHRDGGWLFRRHSINRWDRQQLPWKKPTPWEAQGIA
jgi:hypothetical protein